MATESELLDLLHSIGDGAPTVEHLLGRLALPSAAPRRRRRRLPIGAAAAAAAVLVIAAGAAMLAAGSRHSSTSVGTLASTSPNPRSEANSAPYDGDIVALVNNPQATHGAALQVMLLLTVPSTNANSCEVPSPTLVETPNEIRIVVTTASGQGTAEPVGIRGGALHTATARPPVVSASTPVRSAPKLLCPMADPDPRTGVAVTAVVQGLKSPIGSRRVVDGQTGKPVKVFQPDLPSPAYVPPGYVNALTQPTDPMSTYLGDSRPGYLAPAAVARFLNKRGRSLVSAARIEVIQAPYNIVNHGATVVDHILINGHSATVTQVPTARCVTWSPDGHTGTQICSDTKYAKPASSTDLVSEKELVHIARTLR